MKIGELARRTGLAASRIRYYERIGLLNMVQRQANGYRSYPAEAELVLNLITTGQAAGFSLDELHTLMPPDLAHWDHDALLAALRDKVADIEALQAKLAASKKRIRAVIRDIEAKPADMACETNARRVLSRIGLGEPAAAAPAGQAEKPAARRRRTG